MVGKLIAEEGTAAGAILSFTDGEEWTIGRDPDEALLVVPDPRVSRQHLICRQTTYGYLIENLSTTNPALLNGAELKQAHVLQEGDRVQIGDTLFRFTMEAEAEVDLGAPTEETPSIEEEEESPYETIFEEAEPAPETPSIHLEERGRYLLKVVTGPNTGAELALTPGHSYVLGTDSATCDIVFHDLSVSRQHARLTVNEEEVLTIEDLKSRNGVIIEGRPIEQAEQLQGNSVVSLGTTSFLIIDKEGIQETLVAPTFPTPETESPEEAPPPPMPAAPEEAAVIKGEARPILTGGTFVLILAALALIIVLVAGALSLFQTEQVVTTPTNYNEEVQNALIDFSDVRFAYSPQTGQLFLLGHVLTPVDKSELLYNLNQLDFIRSIEDNVVVNQYVWEEMNNLLAKNPSWAGVSMHSPEPGVFVLSGYLKTAEQLDSLQDYMAINFSYMDRLENQVVVEDILLAKVAATLQSRGLSGVTPRVTNGELTLTGSVGQEGEEDFGVALDEIRQLRGIRLIKNAVAIVSEDHSLIDLTDRYTVQGYSSQDGMPVNVLIDGQIVAKGGSFQGMKVVSITPNAVILEKDGMKYRIRYNQ